MLFLLTNVLHPKPAITNMVACGVVSVTIYAAFLFVILLLAFFMVCFFFVFIRLLELIKNSKYALTNRSLFH